MNILTKKLKQYELDRLFIKPITSLKGIKGIRQCKDCGHWPELHKITLRPNNEFIRKYYVSCERCGENEDRLYLNPIDAIKAWNLNNITDKVNVDTSQDAMFFFVKDILDNCKFLKL